MCPQFVDFDADGYADIVTATYAGSPFIVRGSAAGWQAPQPITNAEGEPIRLAIYWDEDKSRWSNAADGSAMGAYDADGHLVSAAATDWDDDGDLDLLVGSYGGLLSLHENRGERGNAKLAVESEPVMVGGEPFKLEGGLTAPRPVDWDGDGLTDLVCGGFKGGVYLYRNTGTKGQPKFDAATPLIPKTDLPVGEPAGPTSGVYVDPVDYDSDGDLDLLVGGYAEWSPTPRKLTDDDRARIEELQAEMEKLQENTQEAFAEMRKQIEAADTPEERQAVQRRLMESAEYQTHINRQREVWQELSRLQPRQQRQPGIWLYRRK